MMFISNTRKNLIHRPAKLEVVERVVARGALRTSYQSADLAQNFVTILDKHEPKCCCALVRIDVTIRLWDVLNAA